MISDSMPNASIAAASSNAKDFAKKKRANRSAKLKQCKLDARREQWLSQVKNKGWCKDEMNCFGGMRGGAVNMGNDRGMPVKKLEMNPRVEVEFYGGGSALHHYGEFESSPSDSPNSHSSTILGSNDSGINFTASSSSCCSSARSSSSGSSNGCFSGSISEEDERDAGDDGCLDDWEAMADALAATEDKQQQKHSPTSGSGLPPLENHGNSTEHGSQLSVSNQPLSGNNISNVKQESEGTSVQRSLAHCHAWKAGDAFRPQSLPSLSKMYNLSEQRFDQGGSMWGRKTALPVPTSCPICYEDLDCTDSSFLPCLCGFRLCLFCHKRILEDDGRCPGCRKPYNCDPVEGEAILDGGSLTFRLARSCSMVTRP